MIYKYVFFVSDIIGSHMLSQYSDKKIGGVGLTVEIDESLFGNRISFISNYHEIPEIPSYE